MKIQLHLHGYLQFLIHCRYHVLVLDCLALLNIFQGVSIMFLYVLRNDEVCILGYKVYKVKYLKTLHKNVNVTFLLTKTKQNRPYIVFTFYMPGFPKGT